MVLRSDCSQRHRRGMTSEEDLEDLQRQERREIARSRSLLPRDGGRSFTHRPRTVLLLGLLGLRVLTEDLYDDPRHWDDDDSD